nr:MAG TPA: Receptor Binding Protein [Caudoviricetes sp.]
MSYTSGFFDAVDQGSGNYDRVYDAASFAHYFSLLIKNGVFPNPSTGLQVKASSAPNMTVSVQPGSAWINGYYFTLKDTPEVLTIQSNATLFRIDSVILGLNYTSREIKPYVRSSAVSSAPSAVTLQRDGSVYELELARVLVGPGVTQIVQTNIADMRTNTASCGIVAGTIDQIDTTDLFAQYSAAFNDWFEGIKADLGEDVAGNLLTKIQNLEQSKLNISSKATKAEVEAGTNDSKYMTPASAASKLNISNKATKIEVETGTDDSKYMTPASAAGKLNISNKATKNDLGTAEGDSKWIPASIANHILGLGYDVIENTIGTFYGFSRGTVHVVKKGGWCLVHGSLVATAQLSDWVTPWDSSIIPAPQHGEPIFQTIPYWGASYVKPLRVSVMAQGGIRARYGGTGEFMFQFFYPID